MTTSGSETNLLGFWAPRTCSSESQESHAERNLPNHDLDPHAPPVYHQPNPALFYLSSPRRRGAVPTTAYISLSSVLRALSRVFWFIVPGALSLPGTSVLTLHPCRGARHRPPPGTHLGPYRSFISASLSAPQEPSSRAEGSKGKKKEERRATEKPKQNRKCADALGDPPCTHFLHN